MTVKARLYPCPHHCHYCWCHRYCLSPDRLHRFRHQCLGSQQPRQTKAVGHPHLRPDDIEGHAHEAPNVSSMRQIRRRPRDPCVSHTNHESDRSPASVSRSRLTKVGTSVAVALVSTPPPIAWCWQLMSARQSPNSAKTRAVKPYPGSPC
jgi:hypothetical protein